MPLVTRRRTILAKIETTYGTDPTPTGSANAILVRNLNITPLNAQTASRDLVRAYMGASEQLIASKNVAIDFEVEIAGAGAAGTAPAYGPLLRACGLAETITAGVKVAYSPVSTAFESATIYFNVDGVLHKITGARGNVEARITAGQIPVYAFTFTGLYNAPTDASVPSVTYTAFQTPLAANNTNTTGFTFFGHSGVLESLTMNLNNAVNFRSLIGSESVLITDRQAGGTVVFEAPTITTKDFFTASLASTLGTIEVIHGTAAGNKVKLTSAKADVVNPTYQDNNCVHMLSVPYVLVPSTAGNDELAIEVY